MNEQRVSRRGFIKAVGVAGMGSVVGGRQALAQTAPGTTAAAATATVPTRAFGKTGEKVSMLALGGIFDITSNQLVLQRALDFGVTYWDTANSYTNGNSELGIGIYFEKNPEVRKRIFLVTKAGGSHAPDNLTRMLDLSLQRMTTDHIDLYFLHGIRSGSDLTGEIKAWAEKAKRENKIRFFGFSTHGDMENSLQAAAKAGWIDGIMLKYDYRLMQTDAMKTAVDACAKAGVGLTAMKTQGGGPIHTENDAELKLGGHFVQRGFTDKQAKLKAVWDNPNIATICSQMPNVTVLAANVAAALDKTKLTAADYSALREYAAATESSFCAGCTHICEPELDSCVPMGDIMRSLMYDRVYGDRTFAQQVFRGLPGAIRGKLSSMDFGPAQRVCPHGLPIARLMREASETLG